MSHITTVVTREYSLFISQRNVSPLFFPDRVVVLPHLPKDVHYLTFCGMPWLVVPMASPCNTILWLSLAGHRMPRQPMAFATANQGTTALESHGSCHESLNGMLWPCPWQATAASRQSANSAAYQGKPTSIPWQTPLQATASQRVTTYHLDPIRKHLSG